MKQYIRKSTVIAEIEKLRKNAWESFQKGNSTEDQYYIRYGVIQDILSFLDTLEVKDPYEQCVQYDSIKAGIQAHAETYSFNIESELFQQLTKEQQKLWRKEIEQAVISGGEMGVELARDPRYKENVKVKEVEESVSKDLNIAAREYSLIEGAENIDEYAQYDFKKYNSFKDGAKWQKERIELGLKVQKGE